MLAVATPFFRSELSVTSIIFSEGSISAAVPNPAINSIFNATAASTLLNV